MAGISGKFKLKEDSNEKKKSLILAGDIFLLANISAVAAEKAKTEPKEPLDLQVQRYELGGLHGTGMLVDPKK